MAMVQWKPKKPTGPVRVTTGQKRPGPVKVGKCPPGHRWTWGGCKPSMVRVSDIDYTRGNPVDYQGIIETAQRVQHYFAEFTQQLDEDDAEQVEEGDGNPYGGDSVFKMKLVFKGHNSALKGTTSKGMESDKYWEVKVRSDGSVMRKWGATGQKAHMKAEKKANEKAGIAYAKSMASKKMAKGYKQVGSEKATSKKVFPSYKK